jgi:hypothetical protein
MKPAVYIETTIIGHLTTRPSNDPLVLGQMLATRKWWDSSRDRFDVLTSDAVRRECARGDPLAASERLKLLEALPFAPVPPGAESLAVQLVALHALPIKARVDALHVAIAAVNSIQYLLTWNCRHLANVTMRIKIEQTCLECGWTPPIICTPYELSEVDDDR